MLQYIIRMRMNSTGVKGVIWSHKFNKWQARIRADGQYIHLGYFEKIEDAIVARQESEMTYFGELRMKNI